MFGLFNLQLDLSLYKDAGFCGLISRAQVTLDDGLNYKVENQYPDGTGDLTLDLAGVEADVWTSFEIPLQNY